MSLASLSRKALGLVFALVLVAVPAFALTGCANEEQAIKDFLSARLDSLKNADSDTLKSTVGDDTWNEISKYGIDPAEFYGACYKHLSYKVNGVKVDGEKATADLNITNVDINKVANDWSDDLANYMSTAEGLQDYFTNGEEGIMKEYLPKLVDALGADDAPTKTADVQIDLEKKDGSWQASDENQVATALFAGADLSEFGI